MTQKNNDKGPKPDGNEKHRVTNDQGSNKRGEVHRKSGFPEVVDTVAPPSRKPDSGGGNGERS